MKSNRAWGLAALLAVGSAHGATTLTEWGAVASLASSTCASDFCGAGTDAGFLLDLSVDAISGGVGETSAATATTTSWPDPGSAQANGVVAGGLAVPLLTAGATSASDGWLAGQALVIQGYDYTGTGPETIELDWQLTGNVTNPDDDPVTGLSVFVGFVNVGDLDFPDAGSLMDAFAILAGLAVTDPEDNFLEFITSGAVAHSDTLSIDVADGDQFYLAMGLMAAAGGAGAQAESLSTLTAAFRDTPALAPAIAAVPLPAAAWLFAPAVLGLGALVRRRRPQGA